MTHTNRFTSWLLLHVGVLALVSTLSPSLHAQPAAWKLVDSVESMQFFDIHCADSMNCITAGQWGDYMMQVRHSSDGGQSWQTAYLDTTNFYSGDTRVVARPTAVAYPSLGMMVVSTNQGQLLVSYDGGSSWQSRLLRTDSSIITTVCMVDDVIGYALGAHGPIYRTTDGWRTWTAFDLPPEVDTLAVMDMECVSATSLKIMLGRSSRTALASTSDGGATFQVNEMPKGAYAISFVDADRGWFAGGQRTDVGFQKRDFVGMTTNSGVTWDTLLNSESPPRYGLVNIVFHDSLFGLASGQVGKILRTVDGGVTWSQEMVGLDTNMLPHINAIAYMTRWRAVAATNVGYIALSESPAASIDERTIGQEQMRAEYNRTEEQIRLRHTGDGCITLVGLFDLLGRNRNVSWSRTLLCTGEQTIAGSRLLAAGTYYLLVRNRERLFSVPVHVLR